MWKVLLADDEPKIRRGIRKAVPWSELDMEVVGEAEDGEIAFAMAAKLQPDILLVDICMPFLSGLEFIEKLKSVAFNGIIIVITGYDEFSYAQQALRLQVFDYLLKPVGEELLYATLQKARQKLEDDTAQNMYIHWVAQETKKNLPLLRECFCKEWVAGRVVPDEINEQLHFLELPLFPEAGMVMLRVAGRSLDGQLLVEWDRERLRTLMRSRTEAIFKEDTPRVVFFDDSGSLIVLTAILDRKEWGLLEGRLQQVMERDLKQVVAVCQKEVDELLTDVAKVYQTLQAEIQRKLSYTPVVLLCQKYIEKYYYKEELSLSNLAEEIHMSPTYLSRLLKQEIGVSFIEYLTQVRVRKAIQLMSSSTVKMYEIAEQVGYSNQHYFSTAFKKVVGFSPAEYRKRENWS